MLKNYILKLIILFFIFFSTISYAELTYHQLDKSIYSCTNGGGICDIFKVPDELEDYIIDSNLSIDTFFGKKYLLTTLKNNSTANTCYTLYLIDNNTVQSDEIYLLEENHSLCLYEKIGHQLINSFRDGAKWYETLYQEKNGYYQLVLTDECIGCGMIQRFYVDSNKYAMVTDNELLNMREAITKEIKKRTILLNSPMITDKTKMYLVTGDKVRLLQRQDDFYLIEYNSQKKGLIHKWLHCSAIDAC
ncbi:hypothetical protein RHO12_07360 [Orbus sturtevantii]|uniref:hypothetical protein n=1 Tax=Orbus sturtevantii TaxID=3074109 RepID=UPI00370D5B94